MGQQRGFIQLGIPARSKTGTSGALFLRGFTLIELLVVIAIIALLMSILMPALARVRRQAKAAICLSNLKQWGTIFAMYTNAHDGYFSSDSGDPPATWMRAVRPYQIPSGGITCCPMATKPVSEGTRMGAFSAWGIYSHTNRYHEKGEYGSYGINSYVYNMRRPSSYPERDPDYWRRADVKGAAIIPLFLDALWVDGWPNHTDEPPDFEGDHWSTAGGMKRFCINRHNGFSNVLFLDFAVKKVGLKQLWRLKWHRRFDIYADPPDWPNVGTGWTAKFRDYDDPP